MIPKRLRSVMAVLLGTVVAAAGLGVPVRPVSAAAGEQTVAVAPVQALQDGKRSDFIMGADVSELYALEKSGKVYYDTDGTRMSALQVMKNHGVNYIRFRIWNDPTDSYGTPIGGGNTDLAAYIAVAKEAKALGMKSLLDFHYSDFWADPGSQTKPKAWTNLTGEALEQAVYRYTDSTLAALKAEGLLPDMVQIGNEINGGLLWPDGKSAEKAAPFLQQAALAVRQADPGIPIMLHMAGSSAGSAGSFRGNFDTWTSGSTAVDFDIIGVSYYPYWHGTVASDKQVLADLAAAYGKPVIVAETAYGWTLEEGDSTLNIFGQDEADDAGYTPTVQGQAALLRDVVANLADVPGGKGLGLFYWGTAWLPGDETGWKTGEGSAWENQALFDYTGKALASLDVFRQVRGTGEPPAATMLAVDPVLAVASAGGTVSLPDYVNGRYSDGLYRKVRVDSWSTDGVDWTVPGVYPIYGSVEGRTGAAKALVTADPSQGHNYADNPGFEQGTAGWTSTNAAVAKPTNSNGVAARTGSYAAHYWSASSFSDARVYQTVTGLPDGEYTLSAWVDGEAGMSIVPYLYAQGYDKDHPDVLTKADMVPVGWNNFVRVSLNVTVTSGQCTIGTNFSGAAGAWGDVDDFYFGPAQESSDSTKAQAAIAYASGAVLGAAAEVPAGVPWITLQSPTPGAVIYYTTDGSEPGVWANNSVTFVYAGQPIKLEGNKVLKTKTVAAGYRDSDVTVYNLTARYGQGPVQDGGFELAPGSTGAWTLTGVAGGTDVGAGSNRAEAYAGEGYFKYWSAEPYKFTVSQTVYGLSNGLYTLSAYTSGQSNRSAVDDPVTGRAVSDPAIARVILGGQTSLGGEQTDIINRGWNVWSKMEVPGLAVTDGSLTVSFTVYGSAGFWGSLDQVALVRTGSISPGEPGDTDPPAEVSGVQVTAGAESLALTWTDPADSDLSSVKVAGTEGTVLQAVYTNKGVQQVTLSGLTGGAVYKLKLTAVDSSGNESPGVTVSGTPLARSGGDTTYTPPAVASPETKVGERGQLQVKLPADQRTAVEVSLDKDVIRQAAAKTSGTPLAIVIQPSERVTDIKVSVPLASLIESEAGLQYGLRLDTGLGAVTLSPKLLRQAYSNGGGSVLQLAVKKTASEELPEGQFRRLGGRAVYDFALLADGVELSGWSRGRVSAAMPYKLLPGEKPDQVVAYHLDGPAGLEVVVNGRYDAAAGQVVFQPAHFSRYTAAFADMSFSDMQAYGWAVDSVTALAVRGIVEGREAGLFVPEAPVTRAEFLALLARAAQLREDAAQVSGGGPVFSDVTADAWYADVVAAAGKLGLVNGREDGSFGPDRPVTREELAVILHRLAQTRHQAAGKPGAVGPSFPDSADISGYAREAVAWASQAGLVEGMEDGRFAPLAPASRAEASVMIFRCFKLLYGE